MDSRKIEEIENSPLSLSEKACCYRIDINLLELQLITFKEKMKNEEICSVYCEIARFWAKISEANCNMEYALKNAMHNLLMAVKHSEDLNEDKLMWSLTLGKICMRLDLIPDSPGKYNINKMAQELMKKSSQCAIGKLDSFTAKSNLF